MLKKRVTVLQSQGIPHSPETPDTTHAVKKGKICLFVLVKLLCVATRIYYQVTIY